MTAEVIAIHVGKVHKITQEVSSRSLPYAGNFVQIKPIDITRGRSGMCLNLIVFPYIIRHRLISYNKVTALCFENVMKEKQCQNQS